MRDIVMQSAKYRVVKKKRTQAEFLKDVEEGDILQFSTTLYQGRAINGASAKKVMIANVTKGENGFKTINNLNNVLYGWVLEEVSE